MPNRCMNWLPFLEKIAKAYCLDNMILAPLTELRSADFSQRGNQCEAYPVDKLHSSTDTSLSVHVNM